MALIGNLFIRLALESQPFSTGIKQAEAKLDDLQRSMRAAGTGMDAMRLQATRFSVDSSGNIKAFSARFSDSMKSAQASAGSFRQSIAGLAGSMRMLNTLLLGFGAGFLVQGILQAPLAMLKLAGAFEQAQAAFTHFLGSADKANLFLTQLRDFAAKTPFEFPELLIATRRLTAYGFAAQEVIPILTTVGDHVAAIGGGKEHIDRITLALGQMRQAGRLNSQDMRQLTEAGIAGWHFLAEATGKSIAEIRDLTKKGMIDSAAATTIILAGMARESGGMMATAAQRMTGLFSTLVDNLRFLLTDIGSMFIPATTTAIRFAIDVTNELRIALEKHKPAIEAIGKAWEGVVQYYTLLYRTWEKVVPPLIAAVLPPARGTASLGISPEIREEMERAKTQARIAKMQKDAEEALKKLFRPPKEEKTEKLAMGGPMMKWLDDMREFRETTGQARMFYLDFTAALSSGRMALESLIPSLQFATLNEKQLGDTFDVVNEVILDQAKATSKAVKGLADYMGAMESLEKAARDVHVLDKELAVQLAIVEDRYLAGAASAREMSRAEDLYTTATAKAERASRSWADVLKRQVSTVITDLSRNIVDLLFQTNRIAKVDEAAKEAERLFDVLREGGEVLARRGYSQPIAALQNFVDRIRSAGTDTEATQIAIRAFGEQAGVEMAAQIRRGAHAIDEMMKRLREGFPLVEDFRKQLDETGKSGNRIVGIFVEIGKGFARMALESVFHSKAMKKALAAIMDELAGMLKHIPLIGDAIKRGLGNVAAEMSAESAARTAKRTAETAAEESYEAAAGVSGGAGRAAGAGAGGAGAGAGAAGSGVAGIVTAVASVVTAISSVIGNFQMAGMNKSLDLIEKATRYSESHLLEIIGQMQTYLPAIRDNTFAIAYGNVLAMLAQINDAIRIDLPSRLGGMQFAGAGASSAGAMTISISGNNFYGPANSPETVSDLLQKITRELLARQVRPGP